jgi:cell division protein FtsW
MPILIIWWILILRWIAAVYSVSIHESFTLTLKLINKWLMKWDPSNYFYFFRQLKNIFIAVIIASFTYIFPIKFFERQKNIIIVSIFILLLQLSVFIPWVGTKFNWARWWIDMPLIWSMQPAEFFKLWYVLFLWSWLLRKRNKIQSPQFFTSFIILNAIFFWIFLLIPDLWTVLIIWLVGLIMCRYAWAKIKHVLYILFGWLLAWLLVWSIAWMVSDKFNYIQKRFTYFISSEVDPQNRQVWRQTQQALIAIWWGWFSGKWYGKWLQKFWYIPEAQSDFIFAAFSEEMWFVGNIILLWLYFYLAYYFLSRLRHVKDEYFKMIWVWIISLIMIQAFVNIGVNIKILPNTWLTLPFVSYWWTAIMINMIEIVLLYKIIKRK